MRPGIVDASGTVRFSHDDINECRAFLRSAGLECRDIQGWRTDDGAKLGIIDYAKGRWHACWWLNEDGATPSLAKRFGKLYAGV